MTKQLVLVSHGRFCEELKKSTEMIMGPLDFVHTVPLLPQEGIDDFTAEKDLDDYIVFADLLGGTPCNVVSRLILEGLQIELYAGMNMPMVIEFINSALTGVEAKYIEKANKYIVKVNDVLAEMNDDEDE